MELTCERGNEPVVRAKWMSKRGLCRSQGFDENPQPTLYRVAGRWEVPFTVSGVAYAICNRCN